MARVANPDGRRSSSVAIQKSLSRCRGHLALECRHRERPERQQTIVEVFEREGGAPPLGGLPAPAGDLELADLVRAGLPRPGDVTVDLDLGIQARRPRLDHLLDSTL